VSTPNVPTGDGSLQPTPPSEADNLKVGDVRERSLPAPLNGDAKGKSIRPRGDAPGRTPNRAYSSPDRRLFSVWLVSPIFIVGILFLALGMFLRARFGDEWFVLLTREAGAVLMVVAVIHAFYEIVIHRVLHGDIVRLGIAVEDLQRTVSIVGGAVESGLAAVYSSRDDVNKALKDEMDRMSAGSTLRMLGISLGAFLCPHGALHGAFRELLERDDISVEALILDTESSAAIDRARREEPRAFARLNEGQHRTAYSSTRCHNELKTATDFAQYLSDLCYYRDLTKSGNAPDTDDAPNEPPVKAGFAYRVYSDAPLCYLVIFEDYMFLESYHNAGRGGEAPVLKIGRLSGESRETTSLFRIYENHFKVMRSLSRDRASEVKNTAMTP
jgi:hypothetical protein